MTGHIPKLVKSLIISKTSEDTKNILWLEEVFIKKKAREATLVKLFDNM